VVCQSPAGKGKAHGGGRGKKAKGAWAGLSEPLLVNPRKVKYVELSSARLAAEVTAVNAVLEEQHGAAARDQARERDDAAAEAAGTAAECGCCFGDYARSSMLTCESGHAFCVSCVRRYVEETVFGNNSNVHRLPCMDTHACKGEFRFAEVRGILAADLLRRYEKRQAEDCLMRAGLDNLVKCPFCDLQVEVPETQRILKCPRPSCGRESCKLCGEPPHIPLRCEEVEKSNATDARLTIEERMTEARLRICSKCKTSLYKDEGCNKVVCRCGQLMCYVCKGKIAGYQHFCNHPKNPGHPCDKCKLCSLWSSPEEDDAAAVKEAKAAAMKDVAAKDPDALQLEQRPIGPQEDAATPAAPRRPAAPPPPPPWGMNMMGMMGMMPPGMMQGMMGQLGGRGGGGMPDPQALAEARAVAQRRRQQLRHQAGHHQGGHPAGHPHRGGGRGGAPAAGGASVHRTHNHCVCAPHTQPLRHGCTRCPNGFSGVVIRSEISSKIRHFLTGG
jgi:hypothetical protein